MGLTAFHGTGNADAIEARGLDPDCHDRSYTEGDGALRTVGGIYCSSSPAAAVPFAMRAAAEFCGTASVVVLDVDEADMEADEDVLGAAARSNPRYLARGGAAAFAQHLNRHAPPGEAQIALARQWLREFRLMQRDADSPENFDAFADATNRLTAEFRWPASMEYCSHRFAGEHTFRIRKPVAVAHGSSRITAIVDFDTADSGLTLTGLGCRFGGIDDDTREALIGAWADAVEAQGCKPAVAIAGTAWRPAIAGAWR
jgi:hypothetical protein